MNQNVLWPYGAYLGLWSRENFSHYGGLTQIVFDGSEGWKLRIVTWDPPPGNWMLKLKLSLFAVFLNFFYIVGPLVSNINIWWHPWHYITPPWLRTTALLFSIYYLICPETTHSNGHHRYNLCLLSHKIFCQVINYINFWKGNYNPSVGAMMAFYQ